MIGPSLSMVTYQRLSPRIPQNMIGPSLSMVTYQRLSHYQYANLYHDIITGRSITGILHFMNKMPIYWYSKKTSHHRNGNLRERIHFRPNLVHRPDC
jgi:hypothetical protein